MSVDIRTTSEIKTLIISQLEAKLNQSIPLLPITFNRVLANTLAGLFVILFKYCGFIFLQCFPSTATAQPVTINGKVVRPLVEWGRLIGVGDPGIGAQAELTIEVTVENQTGTLFSGTQLLSSKNGVTYISTNTVVLDSATVAVNVRAVDDQKGNNGVGAVGNLDVGDTMSFINPLANVQRDTEVTAVLVTGTDAEEIEDYRTRVIDRFRKLPQGGAPVDYELWGREVTGIINVYPYSDDPGEVDVYVEATEASSGSADGIPTAPQLQAVEDAIELDDAGLASRRPFGAFVTALPITRSGFDVTVTNLVVDDAGQVQTEIEAALETYFLSAEPYIPGLDNPPRRDRLSVNTIISTIESIVSSYGGVFQTVEFEETANPGVLETYTLGAGEKAKLNSVSFDTVTA